MKRIDPLEHTASFAVPIVRVCRDKLRNEVDAVAVEEPLEIRLAFGERGKREVKTISLTMRTPGDDAELAVGFLFSEGIVSSTDQIEAIAPVGVEWIPGESANAIQVELLPEVSIDFDRLERHFYTSSSCGVCGKTSIEAVRSVSPHPRITSPLQIAPDVIYSLPDKLREAQAVFEQTGGLHASALFNAHGDLRMLREDVGRHNALDKVIGAELMAGHLPLSDSILLVSGRASFELVQKAAMAGIPALAAVGAPSSLAVELAAEFGMTLIGFLRGERFNVYSGAGRLLAE